MHRQRWIIVLAAIVFTIASIISGMQLLAQQDGATSPPASTPSETPPGPKSRYSHANDLLIRGTVFNDRGLSLPSVKLSIRRTNEKKKRWETYTNFRGEFAVRVPQGSDYEVVAETKGLAKQSRTINAKNANAEEKLVFHLEPLSGDKK